MSKGEDDILLSESGGYYKKNRTSKGLIFLLICTCICLCLVILFFVGGAITVYLLWPRIPEADIINEETQEFTLGQTPPSINMRFTFDIALDNDNYFDINIEDVDLDLVYQGAKMGNITQLQGTDVTTLAKRTANQTIPMQGIVTAAPTEQILAMIQEATLTGFNTFVVTGNLTVNAISISVVVPITEEIELTPTLTATKAISAEKEIFFPEMNLQRRTPQHLSLNLPNTLPFLNLEAPPRFIIAQENNENNFIR